MNRILIPFTNEHFDAYLAEIIGQPYWYGSHANNCTEDFLQRKKQQYPSHYTDKRMAKYRNNIAKKMICNDCVGVIKGYCWTGGGKGVKEAIGTGNKINIKYGSNACPDRSANGMFVYAKECGMPCGTIDTMPEVKGLCVTYDGHVGYYRGNGLVAEARGFDHGHVITKLKDRKWKHWYCHPAIDYGEAFKNAKPVENAAPVYTLGSRLLSNGSEGPDVKQLQEILVELGYDLGDYGPLKNGVDGDYGNATAKAVKQLQTKLQVTQNGKYDSNTHKALMGYLADIDDADNEPDDKETGKVVIVTGDTVNVRYGPSTNYNSITRVKKDTKLPYVATAEGSGWFAVEINGKVGWISNNYSRKG